MKAFYIPNELKHQLPALQVLFNVLQTFSNLPIGLNPKSRREFETELSAIKQGSTASIHAMRKLTKKMRENKERYTWKRSWHEKLNKKDFWRKQTKGTQIKQAQWQHIEPFSYYDSSDISYLAFQVLPRIKEQLRIAKKLYHSTFPKFIHDTKQQLRQYREEIAQAMLARLKMAANHQDLTDDDVMYHFLDELALLEDFLTKPKHIRSPKKQLSRQDFLRFHTYIEQFGTKETLQEFNRLPWRQLNAIQPSPSHLRSLNWLFKGHNARYHAFHDRYHQISLLLLSRKTTDPLKAYHAFTLEQKRLQNLSKSLNRFFQRRTLSLFRIKINDYKEQRQQILKKAFLRLADLINKKQFSEKDIEEANVFLKAIDALDKTDFPEITQEIKSLSTQLKQKSDEYYSHILPSQQAIDTEKVSKHELESHLAYLLNPNSKDPQYFDKLSQLKTQALMLPETTANKSIKRLFNAGTRIRNIINALPNTLIALFQGEVDQLPLLNQLLIDIIDAKLMLDDEKENLIQLLEIICKQTTLNRKLIPALNGLKNLVKQTGTEHDREHIRNYEKYLKKTSSSKISENIYVFSNTSPTTTEDHSTSTFQPKTGV